MEHTRSQQDEDLMQLTLQLKNRKENDEKYAKFRGDHLIGNQIVPKVGLFDDIQRALKPSNWPALQRIFSGLIMRTGLDGQSAAQIAGSLSDYSIKRQWFINSQVKEKYDKMLHPPLTYLGDAFQYRTADGKFNSVINPHLGQAGAPYAKTVPSITAPLGALPDPGDIFDKLMAREGGRESKSGLSSMLIYHATIIIHDIFRTNGDDKNISDSSSYLDLSPLYGYTDEMQRKVRDGEYKLGLLRPDTFAEDRLLRQPPGVCIMLVMYNRYHNYAARQLYRINENGRFSIPQMYSESQLVSVVKNFIKNIDKKSLDMCEKYETALKKYREAKPERDDTPEFKESTVYKSLEKARQDLELLIKDVDLKKREDFEANYNAAWTKLDDDLFNTARLITCGMYIQVSVHDYLRALMGFHQFNTNFTLDPRSDFDQKKTTRGLGNQVTVEFNLLYRFHCAISLKDERYTEEYLRTQLELDKPDDTSLEEFLKKYAASLQRASADVNKPKGPWDVTFGIPDEPGKKKQDHKFKHFTRNPVTNLFDDQEMINELTSAMDDPISNFGPRNTPKCFKPIEIMGIMQARKWEVGTLNDFREFFGMERHPTFESVTKNVEIQNALRDLYEHPDKVELYPGVFCESDEQMGLDPGPKEASSALWAAIFSDAITLVRSDRFYTVDWNTNSLTSWGMKEVTPDNEICKSSVFHRLIQRAFPGWFPYNSIRFFHPFYTAKQNAIYAREQNYGPVFKETQDPKSGAVALSPKKPLKPVCLTQFEHILFVLENQGNRFTHPVLHGQSTNLPEKMREVLKSNQEAPTLPPETVDHHLSIVEPKLKEYLDDVMRSIVKRESIAMTKSTFQIDVTRDFAIPVVTRYVADFLGFGDKLKTECNPKGKYNENDIYQHITNCQIFLSYNSDETKLLKRRKAFQDSMAKLTELTQTGNIYEANQWGITHALFGRKPTNAMNELGFYIAKQVLEYEKDPGKAAAIVLLICLDFAYKSVVSFTATLDSYMADLYDIARKPASEASKTLPKWIKVQELAFGTTIKDEKELERMVQLTSQATVRLPIMREIITPPPHAPFKKAVKGQMVILDIHAATAEALKEKQGDEVTLLNSQLSIGGKFGVFYPHRFAVLALTKMVKFIAQMKNPRRGHDTQGVLKKIVIDWTAEGYSNFMAPERMDWIAERVKHLPKNDTNKGIFTDTVLKPDTDTYLTPNWDEMVPFPMTWKIRFDGFGESNYFSEDPEPHPYGRINTFVPPDSCAPWYQPQGASHFGGTFAGMSCICAATTVAKDPKDATTDGEVEHEPHCPCLNLAKPPMPKTVQLATGCGISHDVAHK